MPETGEISVENYLAKERILRCFQCGTCVGGCPVANVAHQYNPRKILGALVDGGEDRVLSSELIWLCASCHTCLERCPRDVGLSHIFIALKNKGAKKGKVPSGLLEEASQLMKIGRTVPLTRPIRQRRLELKLAESPFSDDLVELQTIFRATGFESLLQEAKKANDERI